MYQMNDVSTANNKKWEEKFVFDAVLGEHFKNKMLIPFLSSRNNNFCSFHSISHQEQEEVDTTFNVLNGTTFDGLNGLN